MPMTMMSVRQSPLSAEERGVSALKPIRVPAKGYAKSLHERIFLFLIVSVKHTIKIERRAAGVERVSCQQFRQRTERIRRRAGALQSSEVTANLGDSGLATVLNRPLGRLCEARRVSHNLLAKFLVGVDLSQSASCAACLCYELPLSGGCSNWAIL